MFTGFVTNMVFHFPRGETFNVINNLFLAALMAFLAYSRWKLVPLTDRGATAEG